ncbi:MAG: HAMP domain-containing sensor histidine kinase [Verrucomicrobiota bacterium]
MFRFRSLRWKLQGYYALMLLLALSVTTVISIYWIRVSERTAYDGLLRDARHSVIPSLRNTEPVDPGQWKQFEALDAGDPRFRSRGPGSKMGGRGGPPTPPIDGLEELLDKGWFFGGYGYDGTPRKLSRNFPEDLQFDVPVEERKGNILRDAGEYRLLLHREPWGAVLVIGYSKSWFAEGVIGRQWGVVLSSVLVFAVATSLGAFLIGRSLRPLQSIQQAADQIGQGELSTRIPLTSRQDDEMGELSENLNQMFSRFEAMYDRQKRFTSEASHELRTPIAVILGYCQIALEKDRSPQEVQDAIQACRRAGVRMKNLTNDLLELARLESGEVAFDFTECVVRDVAEEAVELIEPVALEKGVILDVKIEDATITANSDRLWQVLVNLLNNAVRHTRAGKSIRLQTAVKDAHLEILVKDEGEGIPPEALPHVFERFYRVDSSRNRKTGGFGLGLAISQTIIQAHGGHIEVQSRLGQGTTFTIQLPI